MARVIITPEASDSRNQIQMLIALAKSTGAAVIISQCLHTRKEGLTEDALTCVDCGATSPLAGENTVVSSEDEGFRHGPALSEVQQAPVQDDECPHGAGGRICPDSCTCIPCHGNLASS